ncbi:MAG: zinc ribbon domain-containing protein [Myxococcaceae bacterium]|nr:zinc ribbon domain-containing protein [Myxococcaceae bacterium]
MPIYEYVCSKCEKTQDVLQKVSDPAPTKCESCGAEGTLSRKVSRTSFVLKGGGWYADLYSSTRKSGSGEGGSSSGSSSSGSGSRSSSGSSSGSSSTAAAAAPSK